MNECIAHACMMHAGQSTQRTDQRISLRTGSLSINLPEPADDALKVGAGGGVLGPAVLHQLDILSM